MSGDHDDETAVAAVLSDLLNRAGTPPRPQQRAVAPTRAATPLPLPHPPTPAPPDADDDPDQTEEEVLADVVPFGMLDPLAEAESERL